MDSLQAKSHQSSGIQSPVVSSGWRGERRRAVANIPHPERQIGAIPWTFGVHDTFVQNFRRLDVWCRAHSFAVAVRHCTRGFPRSGYAELKSQLTRAAESIATNIVEGCGAATPKEFARYLDIGIKSTSEAEYQLQLAKDYRIIGVQLWARLTREAVEIRKMLFGLRRAVLASRQTPPKPRDSRTNSEEGVDSPDGATRDDREAGRNDW